MTRGIRVGKKEKETMTEKGIIEAGNAAFSERGHVYSGYSPYNLKRAYRTARVRGF